MVVTIQQVLRPLLITNFIMGLGTYPKKQLSLENRWIAHLSILYCLIIWFFYAYSLSHALSSFFLYEFLRENTLFSYVLVTNIFTTVISAIMNFYHQKKFEISLKKFSTVDDSLEELGVPKAYQKIHICSKLVLIGWIVFSLIRIVFDIMWITKSNESYFGILFLCSIINHCLHVNELLDLLFIFLLWCVATGFDKLNECMRCLLVRDHGLRCIWKKSVVTLHRYTLCTDYKQTLWTSMHLHLELCSIVRELNFIFGTQIIFGMVIYLMYFTSICYNVYVMLMQKYPKDLQRPIVWFNIIFCLLVLLIRAYAVNYICQSVMDKANKIDKIIHQLTNTLRYSDSYQEVYQFTLQVMHRPLKLTGLNLYYLGNECFQKLCITVVTYVIIMVQMKINIRDT